jgi:hypothetical protein
MMDLPHYCFGPVVRLHIMTGSMWQNKTAHLMARKQKRRDKDPLIPFKGMPPMT